MFGPVFNEDPLYVWIGDDNLVHLAERDALAFLCGRPVGPGDRRSYREGGTLPGVSCPVCYCAEPEE